jgi:hypothetical protein
MVIDGDSARISEDGRSYSYEAGALLIADCEIQDNKGSCFNGYTFAKISA